MRNILKLGVIASCMAIVFVSAFTDYQEKDALKYREYNSCDLEVKDSLCLLGGTLVINSFEPDASLLAMLSFDKARLSDESKNKCSVYNYGISEGSGLKGYGRSGHVATKFSFIKIHGLPTIQAEYSVSFSLYIQQIFREDLNSIEDRQIRIFEKFHGDDLKNLKISIGQLSRKIFLTLPENSEDDQVSFKTLESISKIQLRKWVQITVVKKENLISLYFNGHLENQFSPSDRFAYVEEIHPYIFIGNSVLASEKSDNDYIDYLIDEVKILGRPLKTSEIQAKAEQFLGGLSSDFYNVVCQNCSKEAVNCSGNYHVCSAFEVLAEGFQFARSMGWIDALSPFIWTREGVASERLSEQTGLGLCCKNISDESRQQQEQQ